MSTEQAESDTTTSLESSPTTSLAQAVPTTASTVAGAVTISSTSTTEAAMATGRGSSASTPESTAQTISTAILTSQTSVNAGDQGGSKFLLNQNAIIAGVLVGLLVIGIVVVAVWLAKARRRRHCDGSTDRDCPAKTGGPAEASGSGVAREPNPYANACFNASKEEMGERTCQTEEPAKTVPGTTNSVRNKEDHWIIPLEELADDDPTTNFDTTKF